MQVVEVEENQQTAQEFKLHFHQLAGRQQQQQQLLLSLLTPESPSSSVLTKRTSQRGEERGSSKST
jgi:hypothetical protein